MVNANKTTHATARDAMPRLGMRRSSSLPHDMHSELPRRGVVGERTCISGACLIKPWRGASNAMEVTLTCTEDRLKVSFAQERSGVVHRFTLCELWLSALAVGWLWGEADVFALAAVHGGCLHHSIFVYPTTMHRNEWLCFFETRRLLTAPFALFERFTANVHSVSLLSPVREADTSPPEEPSKLQ